MSVGQFFVVFPSFSVQFGDRTVGKMCLRVQVRYFEGFQSTDEFPQLLRVG